MATILLVEDDHAIRRIVQASLDQAGHEVVPAETGEKGLRLAQGGGIDLVLLDIALPDVPGTDICRELKRAPETSRIPIVFLTGRGDEVDRVVGFELGASDYVVKPFSVRELTLRVNAVLRRSTARTTTSALLEIGCLRINEEGHRVWVDGKEIELTLLEFRLLVALFENRHRVQSRSLLLDGVWGLDIGITTRTVDTHVKRLRDKLGRAGDYIQTVRGIGYRFDERAEGETGT
jgi:two-component system phosphate regulon response regulator PhoB